MVKTKALTACLGDGNRAQQGIWRCNTSVNSSRGLLKAQGEKLYAFCMWSLLQAASQTSETAPQTALRGMSQSSQGSCLLFKQHQQSVSQHTRMLLSCVLLSSIFSANAARFAPSLGSGISPHPWKNIMLKRGKEGLSSHLLTSHLGCTCHYKKVLLFSLLLLQACYFLSMLTCRDQGCYRKSEQTLQTYQMAVIPSWLQCNPFSSLSHFCRDLGRRELPEAQDIVIIQHNQALWWEALFSPDGAPVTCWEDTKSHSPLQNQ